MLRRLAPALAPDGAEQEDYRECALQKVALHQVGSSQPASDLIKCLRRGRFEG